MKNTVCMAGLLTALAVANLPAAVINVPGDYPTIQEGIDACSEWDTVMVADGVYPENLVVSMPVTLMGQSRDSTIIDGIGNGDVIFIDSARVHIYDFTIRNGGDALEDAGIEISFSDSCLIDHCRIEDNNSGLCLYGSSYNEIARSLFISNYNGIQFREAYNEISPENLLNTVRNNIISDNDEVGILMEHTGSAYHHSNIISGNLIIGNYVGISSIMCQENRFINNDIVENIGYGAVHAMCLGGGEHNEFHHNNFIANHSNLCQASDAGGGLDYWYCADDQRGNYWSNYYGSDQDGDGIGDTPYDIDGGESQDLYPLMSRYCALVEGVVSDGLEPIEGVIIIVCGTEICDTSDVSGAFALDDLGSGMCDISFSHPVYDDMTMNGIPTTIDETTQLDVVMDVQVNADDSQNLTPENYLSLTNYPNPFNARTILDYDLPYSVDVTVEIFDMLGRLVKTIVNGRQNAGHHRVEWDAFAQTSGVYFCRIQANDITEVKRLVLLK